MKKFILMAVAFTALFSCAKQPEMVEPTPEPTTPVTRRVVIGATLPQESKVDMEESTSGGLKTLWSTGDLIAAIFYDDVQGKYVSDIFELIGGAGTSSGTFESVHSTLPDDTPFTICYPVDHNVLVGNGQWTMQMGNQDGTLDKLGEVIPLVGTAANLDDSPELDAAVTILRLKQGLKLFTQDSATGDRISFTVSGQSVYSSATFDGSTPVTFSGNKGPVAVSGNLTVTNGILDQDVYIALHLDPDRSTTILDIRAQRYDPHPNYPPKDTYNWTLTRSTMENGQMYSIRPGEGGAHPALPAQQVKTYIPTPVNILYIATDGNDGNSGTIDAPLATLQEAFDRAQAGTHIYLRGSTDHEHPTVYTINKGWLAKKGTEEDPIVISARPYGVDQYESVVLDASTMTHSFGNTDDAFIGLVGPGNTGADWVRIRELTIKNSPAMGIGIVYGSSHVTVENCNIEDCPYPAIGVGFCGTESEDIRIYGNMIINCAQADREAISLRKVNGFQVYNNHLKHIPKEAIDAKNGSRNGSIYDNLVEDAGDVGIYVDAGYANDPSSPGVSVPVSRNILIYGNQVVFGVSGTIIAPNGRAGTGISVASEQGNSASDIYIYNNLVYNVSGLGTSATVPSAGIKVAHNNPASVSGTLEDIYIYNNTVYNMTQQGIYVNYPTIENIVIRNNLVAYNQAGNISVKTPECDDTKVIIQNNMFFDIWGPCSHPGEPSWTETVPEKVFVKYWDADWKKIDLHIPAGSLAIGNGTPLTTPEDDFDHKRRIHGTVDIGAYKYE